MEAEKSKIKVQAILVSGEGLLPCFGWLPVLLCPHMAEGLRELSEIYKDT